MRQSCESLWNLISFQRTKTSALHTSALFPPLPSLLFDTSVFFTLLSIFLYHIYISRTFLLNFPLQLHLHLFGTWYPLIQVSCLIVAYSVTEWMYRIEKKMFSQFPRNSFSVIALLFFCLCKIWKQHLNSSSKKKTEESGQRWTIWCRYK